MKNRAQQAADRIASSIGKGIIAGLVGTAAITLVQLIEKKIKREEKQDTKPADAVIKTLDIRPSTEADKPKLAQRVHWTYGTLWGIAYGLLRASKLKPVPASIVQFVLVSGAAMFILPSTKVAPPVKKWDMPTIASSSLNHAVYAAATALGYAAINEKN